MWVSWMRSMVKRWFKSLTQDSLPSLCLHLANYPVSFFTPDLSSVQFSLVAQSWPTLCNPMNRSMPGLPVHHKLLRPSPKIHVQLFAKMDSTAEACGDISTLVIWWGPLPFPPPRSLTTHMQTEKVSLISRVGTLSLYFSRTQLLLLALSLECP